MALVELLGRPRALVDNEWQLLPGDKRGALLLYLAVQADWVSRDELAFVFWPDTHTKTAKANLRQVLRRTRLLPFGTDLESEGQQLRWQCDSDLSRFKVHCESGQWASAVEAYNDHLSNGFTVPDAEGFTAWLELERSELQQSWQNAVEKCSETLAQTDRHAEAAKLIKKVWQLDAFDEAILQRYLRQAALAGQKDAALKVYEDFTTLLRADIGLEPLPETKALAEGIKQGTLTNGAPVKTRGNLELRSGVAFVGREQELNELKAALAGEQRVIALLGLGGVGKSRLALELAKSVITEFEHGVNFVALASATPETLLSTVAAALSFSFYGNKAPQEQLFDYLRQKEMLLVLDNFEHLTEEAGFVLDLTREAPALRVLLTSREKPEIPNLRHVQLRGLNHEGADSAASQLFLSAAKGQLATFAASEQDEFAISELCQLTEGLPLALELASVWVAELGVAEIVAEIRANLSFLRRDGERNHDSLNAVLDYSWSLLSPEQQDTLAKLSVFRGGFTKDAARVVAGSSNYLTLNLINRSLLRTAGGRYDLHEVVRQFAETKLIAAGVNDGVQQSHADFYSQTLGAADFSPHRRREALRRLDNEGENIRRAWRFQVSRQNAEAIAQSYVNFSHYLQAKSLFQEAISLFKRARAQFSADPVLANQLALQYYSFSYHLGHWQEVTDGLKAVLAILKHQEDANYCSGLNTLAWANHRLGNNETARGLFERALELSQASQLQEESEALNGLATLALNKSNYETAIEFYEQSIELTQDLGDTNALAYRLKNLGLAQQRTGQFERARSLFEQSLTLHEEKRKHTGAGVKPQYLRHQPPRPGGLCRS